MRIRKVYNEITHRELLLPEKCERIVSFSPAITESLFLMGLGEYVKGVSVYCVHPEEARENLIIGSYNSYKEKVIDEINPDIIFTTTGYQLELINNLIDKYPVYPIRLPPTVSHLISGCVEAGLAAGYCSEARELQSRLLQKLDYLQKINLPKNLKVYIEIDLGGPVTFGAYSYITDGLKFLGLKNVFEDEMVEWLIPDDKSLRTLNPDLIIYEPKMFSKKRNEKEIKTQLMERFGEINALVNDRLFITPGDYDFFAHHGPGFVFNVLPWLSEVMQVLN